MSRIADHITANSMLLLNESFAATNEREGSEIARQIVCALLEKRITIFFVTHLSEFARRFSNERPGEALFLSAERRDDGQRTYRILPSRPLSTSFGADVYYHVFGTENWEDDGARRMHP